MGANISEQPCIVWFRNDLRLADHRALSAAAATGRPLVLLYILDDVTPGSWPLGAASRWWLDKSLAALGRDIEKRGNRLVLRRGPSLEVLSDLVRETNAAAVYCSRAYEPWASELEAGVKHTLGERGVDFRRFAGALLKEPEEIKTKLGEPFKVYSPFWRALWAAYASSKTQPAPVRLAAPATWPQGDRLGNWELHPEKPHWSAGLGDAWSPGEAGAHGTLKRFLKSALASYDEARNAPGVPGTSRLSPHLHFGEITPAMCWLAAEQVGENQRGAIKGLETFLKELVWREFSYTLLVQRPDLPERAFRPEFESFPWAGDDRLFKAWTRGRTGYPIVDAGMRELWHTGYMHNRVRMIAASFLTKDLLIPWQKGAAWFWDTLVDADLASNSASWQWVAGCGADAAPYFRIFNPVSQGTKFDPDGAYVRRWIPEIARLPGDFIHEPWGAPADVLRAAGVELGRTYPRPVVNHDQARIRALAAYGELKTA